MRKSSDTMGSDNITIEMYDHYHARTASHIDLVRKYCEKLSKRDGPKGLPERAKVHDSSKFGTDEMEPYIWVTWRYKCQQDGVECRFPVGMNERMMQATEHHILTNSHHPESHQERRDGLLNSEDRDRPPAEIVDATRMSALDIAEMVADWMAVSEERGNTPREWADRNVNIRWRFTDEQCDLIYDLIDYAWVKQ